MNNKPKKSKGFMFIHTSDLSMIKKFKDSGIDPICVVGDRYTFIYNRTTKLTCDAYEQTSYVIDNTMMF